MMRVLAYSGPGRGQLFPIVPVICELIARKHDVAVCALGGQVGDLGRLGARALPLGQEIAALKMNDWKGGSAEEALALAMGTLAARAPLEARELQLAVDRERPDVLLVDVLSFGAMAVAEASGIPWATWLHTPAWLRGPGIPPYGPGLPPMSGPEGAARDQAVARGLAGAASAFTGAVNAGRATVGLGPLSEADEILLRPPLVLYLTSEPFEYPRPQWPPTFRLIGPCAWDPPQPPPEWLANERRGLVIVTTSSEYQGDESLISTALQALRDRTSLCVIATVPSGDAHYDYIPNNARIERFVAHSHLLPRAVAVVCHAGMGITQKALTAGVPVCCVPFGRDQFEVARRVEVAGAGTLLPAAELTPDRLRVTFERALLCRSGAAGIAAAFARTGGARAGADALEQIARRRAIGIRPD